ncbi:MAG: hypothetical protein GX963_08145 [Bacteroidales bacterium]|nr:hypothetical protein [Bacteroidales bacterium]
MPLLHKYHYPLIYPKNLEGSVIILAEKRTVRIGGVAMNKIETWQFADNDPMDEAINAVNTNPKSVYGSGHLDYYSHVIDVLDGKADPIVTGREARKTVEIIEAAYKKTM